MTHKCFNIYHHLVINKEPKAVFEARTKPEYLNNWWPLKSSGKPVAGTEYNLYFGDKYDWYGEVVKSVPNQSFQIKMTKSDKDWDPTSFGFDLEKHSKSRAVTFQHVNWPECNIHFKTSSFCWAILLKDLKNYLEQGVIIPFENRE